MFVSKSNPAYVSAYLYLSNESNNDDVFWPWNDQFYKIFVRDRDPDILNRMDKHTSYVTKAADGNWEKPVGDNSPTGYGGGNYMSHFDLLTNQHGYFSKNDEVYVQVLVEDYRNLDTSSLLDDCEPCYGPRDGERVCKMNKETGKSYCGCSGPMELVNGECVCP